MQLSQASIGSTVVLTNISGLGRTFRDLVLGQQFKVVGVVSKGAGLNDRRGHQAGIAVQPLGQNDFNLDGILFKPSRFTPVESYQASEPATSEEPEGDEPTLPEDEGDGDSESESEPPTEDTPVN